MRRLWLFDLAAILAPMVGACQIAGSGSPDPSSTSIAAVEPAAGPVYRWPAPKESCSLTIGAVLEQWRAGRLPVVSEGAPVEVVLPDHDRNMLRLRPDISVPIVVAKDHKVGCSILLDPLSVQSEVNRHPGSKRTVLSEYPGRGERRINPEYEKIRRALDDLDEGSARRDGHLTATGDMTIDIIGLVAGSLIKGLGSYYDNGEKAALQAKLESTPRYVEEERWTSYRLQAEDVAIEKSTGASIVLVDGERQRFWPDTRRIRQSASFVVGEGVHPRDREVSEGRARYATLGDLEAYEHDPIEVPVSDVLQWALDAARSTPMVGNFSLPAAQAMQPPDLEPAAGPAPAARGMELVALRSAELAALEATREVARPAALGETGIVSIIGAAGTGLGFFVSPDDVVTASVLISGSSLVELQWPDSFTSWGVLVDVDEELGLALVHSPKSNASLTIERDRTLGQNDLTEEVPSGAPLLRDGEVAGVVVDGSTARVRDATALVEFLARMNRLHATSIMALGNPSQP